LFFFLNKKTYRKPVCGVIPVNQGINHCILTYPDVS
jgi:hypothetical protein